MWGGSKARLRPCLSILIATVMIFNASFGFLLKISLLFHVLIVQSEIELVSSLPDINTIQVNEKLKLCKVGSRQQVSLVLDFFL